MNLKNTLNLITKSDYTQTPSNWNWYQFWNSTFASRITYFYHNNDFFTSISFVQILRILFKFSKNGKFSYHKFLFPHTSEPFSRRRKGSRLKKLGNHSLTYLVPFSKPHNALRLSAFRRARKTQTLSKFRRLLSARAGHLHHHHFESYSSLLKRHYFQMFNPYIRVSSHVVGIYPQETRRTIVRWRELQKNAKNFKRAHFLNLLLTLTKKVRVTTLTRKYYPLVQKYVNRRLDYKLNKRPKYHLLPRQSSYLNIRGRINLRAHGSLHRLLTRRAYFFYKASVRKLNIRALNFRRKSKNLKFNWKRQFAPWRKKPLWTSSMFSKRRAYVFSSKNLHSVLNRRVLLTTLSSDRRMKGRVRKPQSMALLRRSFFNPRTGSQRRINSIYRGLFRTMRRNKRSFRRRARRKKSTNFKTKGKKRKKMSILRIRAKVRPNPTIRKLKRLRAPSRSRGVSSNRIVQKKRQPVTRFLKLRATNVNKLIAREGALLGYRRLRRGLKKTNKRHVKRVKKVSKRGIISSKSLLFHKKTLIQVFLRRYPKRSKMPTSGTTLRGFRKYPLRDFSLRRFNIGTCRLIQRILVQRVSKSFRLKSKRSSRRKSLAPLFLFLNQAFLAPNRLMRKSAISKIKNRFVKKPRKKNNKWVILRKRQKSKRQAKRRKRDALKAASEGASPEVVRAIKKPLKRRRKKVSKFKRNSDVGEERGRIPYLNSLCIRRGSFRSPLNRGYKSLRRLPFFNSSYFELQKSPKYSPLFTGFYSRFKITSTQALLLNYSVGKPQNLSFYSQYRAPFVFSMFGFLYVQTNKLYTTLRRNDSRVYSRIQRHKYSFFYKNDIKRFYLRKSGKLKLLSSFVDPLNFVNHSVLHKNLFKRYLHPITGVYSMPSDGTMAASHLHVRSELKNYQITPLRYTRNLSHNTFFEPRIKRIRFKPGYSRIWRRAREAINYSLSFHFRYQYRLTRHLNKLQRVQNNSQFKMYDWSLLRVVLNTHFVYDLHTSLTMIQSHLVFVNGICSVNPSLQLHLGDFIQIPVDLKYYVLHRWLVNFNLHKRLRLTKLSQSKNNKSRYDLSKQRSTHLPDWIFRAGYRSFDIPKYLEVDYFTLSAFIIYEPFSSSDFNPLAHLEARTSILNMYNWKYIN
jgi:hypothetical protein